MTTPKPLRFLYGASDRHKNTVKSMISPGERPQEIYTPECVLEPLYEKWGQIALDPCWSPNSPVKAEITYTEEDDGLYLPWVDKTYFNPPYKYLHAWLDKACAEKSVAIGLVPVRTHRAWFRAAMRETSDLLWLDPLKFVGFDQAFPAPLCLMAWRCNLDEFEHLGGR